jgi:hypothetical protein
MTIKLNREKGHLFFLKPDGTFLTDSDGDEIGGKNYLKKLELERVQRAPQVGAKVKTPDLDQLAAWYFDPVRKLPRKVTEDMRNLITELRAARKLIAEAAEDKNEHP